MLTCVKICVNTCSFLSCFATKNKAEVTRLTNKNDDAQNTIAKLRKTMRHSFSVKEYNALLQKKYNLENELSGANEKASLAEEEVLM